MNEKEILEKLPSSWETFLLEDFQKIASIENIEQTSLNGKFDGVETTLNILEALTGLTRDELEGMPLSTLQKYSSKISFLQHQPVYEKRSSIEWKSLEEITTNDFITYNSLANNALPNLHYILKAFSKNKRTEDEILKMNMQDALNGFFLLRQKLQKFSKTTQRYLLLQLIKQKLKEKIQAFKQKWVK
jgi:hypothetical protein